MVTYAYIFRQEEGNVSQGSSTPRWKRLGQASQGGFSLKSRDEPFRHNDVTKLKLLGHFLTSISHEINVTLTSGLLHVKATVFAQLSLIYMSIPISHRLDANDSFFKKSEKKVSFFTVFPKKVTFH